MKKIMIAVDDTKGSKNSFGVCQKICTALKPESVTLLFVEKFEGRSLMDDMLGDAEMSTLKEVLAGTEYKDKLDAKAKAILDYYKAALEGSGAGGVKTLIKEGHPADEILNAAKEEGSDMIIVGSHGKRVSHVFMGSVSREVVNRADVPVLVAKA